MKKSPPGITKKEFRVEKRLEFAEIVQDINRFMDDEMYMPVPPDVWTRLMYDLEDIEFHIGTEYWGH